MYTSRDQRQMKLNMIFQPFSFALCECLREIYEMLWTLYMLLFGKTIPTTTLRLQFKIKCKQTMENQVVVPY